jgi:hypothetical protein
MEVRALLGEWAWPLTEVHIEDPDPTRRSGSLDPSVCQRMSRIWSESFYQRRTVGVGTACRGQGCPSRGGI